MIVLDPSPRYGIPLCVPWPRHCGHFGQDVLLLTANNAVVNGNRTVHLLVIRAVLSPTLMSE